VTNHVVDFCLLPLSLPWALGLGPWAWASRWNRAFGVVPERGRQDFQRDVAAEFRIGGAVHLTHSTHAEEAEEVVVAEAASEGHGRVGWHSGRGGSKRRAQDLSNRTRVA
jgi:hypothetical protein